MLLTRTNTMNSGLQCNSYSLITKYQKHEGMNLGNQRPSNICKLKFVCQHPVIRVNRYDD
jgi:hypothetical protein